MISIRSLETSGTNHPTTRCNSPEEPRQKVWIAQTQHQAISRQVKLYFEYSATKTSEKFYDGDSHRQHSGNTHQWTQSWASLININFPQISQIFVTIFSKNLRRICTAADLLQLVTTCYNFSAFLPPDIKR
jgi:hypothetical protein